MNVHLMSASDAVGAAELRSMPTAGAALLNPGDKDGGREALGGLLYDMAGGVTGAGGTNSTCCCC